MPLDPAQRGKQMCLCEFKVNLSYRANSKAAKATKWDLVLNSTQ